MGDFPTSHGSGKHYRVAPAEGKWRLTIVLPWWCHEYHWETLSYMAFPRHAEVGTASAILDSLGWDGLGRRRHSLPGDGNWNHAAPLDLQNISAEFNSSVVVHQHNFRDTWPNLWYNAIPYWSFYTSCCGKITRFNRSKNTGYRQASAVLHEAGQGRRHSTDPMIPRNCCHGNHPKMTHKKFDPIHWSG